MKNLLNQWRTLCAPYGADRRTVDQCWLEISRAYQGKRRYYHNLQHLRDLLIQADQQQSRLEDYDALRFSIFYHDIIYSSLRRDNEVRSAQLAQKKLKELGFPVSRISRCEQQIRATQRHLIPPSSSDPDLAYMLDFDLAILGTEWERYEWYIQQIRKEYQIYPTWMYRKGRRKVLAHFLERPSLFFTPVYMDQFELKARNNLQKELLLL